MRLLDPAGPDARAAMPTLLACLDAKYHAGDGKTECYAGSREIVLVALERIDAETGKKARREEARRAEEYRLWLNP